MSSKIVLTDQAPAPIGPYNQAVITGNLMFVSGQIAFDVNTNELVMDSIEKETHQVMHNILSILKAVNTDFSSIVKSTIFLKDLNDYDVVNRVYGSFFNENAPARECVQVVKLPKDVNVEISVIASL